MHDAGCLGLVHWDDPEGWYREGGGRRVQDGEHMYYLWWIHVDIWQNQYNIVKLKNKILSDKKKTLELIIGDLLNEILLGLVGESWGRIFRGVTLTENLNF